MPSQSEDAFLQHLLTTFITSLSSTDDRNLRSIFLKVRYSYTDASVETFMLFVKSGPIVVKNLSHFQSCFPL